jgi:hypothetical protein
MGATSNNAASTGFCLRSKQMIRTVLTTLIFAIAFSCSPLFAQESPVQDSTDLKVELRPATGSNRFQLGEVIPLEVFISSSKANRYLEPCKMFWESCFGYPQCRFVTNWSFDVVPNTGWTDIGWHGCMAMSGPTMDVKSSDLTMEPKKYSYTLTNRFRFDTPGNYTVRLSLTVGADAAEYLGRYGSAAMKPVVWEQLSRWHRKYVESGAKQRMSDQKNTQDDWQLYNLDSRLLRAYVNAQGWTLSPTARRESNTSERV